MNLFSSQPCRCHKIQFHQTLAYCNSTKVSFCPFPHLLIMLRGDWRACVWVIGMACQNGEKHTHMLAVSLAAWLMFTQSAWDGTITPAGPDAAWQPFLIPYILIMIRRCGHLRCQKVFFITVTQSRGLPVELWKNVQIKETGGFCELK